MTLTLKLTLTLAVIGLLILTRIIVHWIIGRTIIRNAFDVNRRKMVSKIINFLWTILLIIGLTSVWGLNSSDVVLFISSILTVLGVAFFAQWSHLSNITGGVMLFFNSSIRIGDQVAILDKDFDIQGSVKDIQTFYVVIETDEKKLISIPNNIFFQKSFTVKSK